MDKHRVNEAAAQLIDSFQQFNQTVLENASAAHKQHWQLLQSLFADWIELVNQQTRSTATLAEAAAQENLTQLEASQRLAAEAVEASLALLSAPLSVFPPSLRLQETLQICLLALTHRYPYHLLDINEALLDSQPLGAQGWRAADLIEWLESRAPALLQEQAHLEVNSQRRGIYLLARSEQIPAFWVHCGERGEKMPPYWRHVAARRHEQGQTPEISTP